MAYVAYKYRQGDKLADVASQFNTTIEEIMKVNNIQPPYPTYVQQLPQEVIGNGFLKTPFITNGHQSFETYFNTAMQTLGAEYENSDSLEDFILLNRSEYSGIDFFSNQDFRPGRSYKDCYISYNLAGTPYWSTWGFPCYPESVSDSNSASYSAETILGRSEPFQYYTGSGPRTVNVAFQMHTDMCADVNYVYNLTSLVESFCYPNYNGTIAATKVLFHCSNNITIQGVITNVGTKYSGPIIDNKYAVIDLDFSITEVTGNPKSRAQIASMGGNRWS